MRYDQDVFINQFPIVKFFIYHLIYSRVVRDSYLESQLLDEFWTLTIDAHLLRATINWCMVFGSDSNSMHWKRLIKPSKKNLAQSFRDGLFETTGLDKEHWQKYWKSMTEFRNKYAAHRELRKFTDPVPNFDTALAVAYHYDRWVRNIISPAICEEPPLEQFSMSLKQSVTPLVSKLIMVTKEPI